MKTVMKLPLIIALIAAAGFFFGSCPGADGPETFIPVDDIKLNPSTLALDVDRTRTLTTTISPSSATNQTVMWSSSDSSVASIDANGRVTAKKAGTAVIIVSTVNRGKVATCTVTVAPLIAAVTFNSVTANGSATETTTELTLTFSQAITGLSAADITISGVSGARKGTLRGSGSVYTLPIDGFTDSGNLTVAVEKFGYIVSGSPKSTYVYYYTAPTVGIVINLEDMDEWDLTELTAWVDAGVIRTFTVNGSYMSYQWYLDGTPVGTSSTYTFNQPDGVYQLVVVATNSAGETRSGRCWVTVGGSPPSAVSAPTGVSATAASSGSITVSWNAVSGASSYRVYRATSSTGMYSYVGTANSASYTDTGLSASTTYYYKVGAVNAGGSESSQSAYAYATTLPSTTPTTIDMVRINGGTFTMGSPTSESGRDSDETQHSVTLSGFYMGKYQVTQGQYQAVMGSLPSSLSSSSYDRGDNYPVYYVSWYDAIVFCNKLSMREGLTPAYRISGSTDPSDWGSVPTGSNSTWNGVTVVSGSTGYRLPTEAQWEYACRAGTTTAYNTGDTITSSRANYNSNIGRTTEVGSYAPNAWGLYDMHGNVWEWCWDWYGSYSNLVQTDPTGAASGTNRVARGGSWDGYGQYVRSAYRGYDDYGPGRRDLNDGIRVVYP